jgi:hypothetical protein
MTVKPPTPEFVGPAKHHGGKTNLPINRLVVHCTAGSEPRVPGAARATVRYSESTDRPSSYHYIADAEERLQYVYDSWVAYHAPPNEHSLGYELCCSLSNQGKGHWDLLDHKKMIKMVSRDFARLALAYDVPIRKIGKVGLLLGRKGICGHNDISVSWGQTSHWDPGPYFPWYVFIRLIRGYAEAIETPGKQSGIELAIRKLEKRKVQTEKSKAAIRYLKSMRDI